MKYFKAIAAMSENRVIGADNKIPWHLPEDFRWFKRTTTGHVVVMGRRTFESLGKPLPNRVNIVLTRHPGRLKKNFPELFADAWVARGKTRVASAFQFELPRVGGVTATDLRLVKSLLKLSPDDSPLDFFICGGAQVYEQALPLCSDLYLTRVKRVVEGDAFFPVFEDRFVEHATILDCPDFTIVHYRNRRLVGVINSE